MTAIKSFGLESYIDIIVCGDDHGAKPKPNPDNALAICRALNVDPEVGACVFHMSISHSRGFPITKCQNGQRNALTFVGRLDFRAKMHSQTQRCRRHP